MELPGRKKSGQVMALGHADTVWPVGTLRTMPFRRGRWPAVGAGRAGYESRASRSSFSRCGRCANWRFRWAAKVLLQLNSDEEVGSQSSRALTEKNAARSQAVLVLEPGTGLEGKLKTARKGVGDFTVAVRGKASHAGVDFQAGASAVLELARQIERIAGFTRTGARHHRQSGGDRGGHALQCGGRRSQGGGRYPRAAPEGRAGAGEEIPRAEAVRPAVHHRSERRI